MTPSGSTGVQPSAEAIEALYVCENCGLLAPMSGMQDECRTGWTHGRLVKVQKVDAPAIAREAHAAGVAEGRAAMLREVAEILRSFRTRPHEDAPHSPVMLEEAVWMNRAAGFIEARFPSEGTT